MPPFTFPPQLPSISFQPIRYRPNGIGYWSGHIPFACDLVATFRPQTFVELGTHMGESYFAICQAIAESNVECRAFAVDTWDGDQHTGMYDDSVYSEVDQHNDEHYGQFSTLLRMSFDEAARRFGEDSIDLLHIDGAHTYEAVSHDFLNWWPKVKPGGVVLLHDSFERQESFGVWQLLEELRGAGIPVGDFFHSHGLGVLVKQPVRGDEHVAASFVTANDDLMRQMRNYYEVCAASLQGHFLQDKLSRPAEWEITSQLFWRTGNQAFAEKASVRCAQVVDAKPREVTLYIPHSSVPYSGFRLALTLVPAMLKLFSISVTTSSGESLWSLAEPEGILFAGDPHDAVLDLDLPASVQSGAKLTLVLVGVDPFSATGQLTS